MRRNATPPGRDVLVKEWLAIDARTPPRYTEFQVEGGRVFYRKTNPGETVGKLYVRDGWNGKERLLFDPLAYRQGAHYAMSYYAASMDGTRVIVHVAQEGAEWGELRVLDAADGKMHEDRVAPVWFGGSWLPDGIGLSLQQQARCGCQGRPRRGRHAIASAPLGYADVG